MQITRFYTLHILLQRKVNLLISELISQQTYFVWSCHYMKPRLQTGINICKNQQKPRVFFEKCAETFIYLIVFHSNVTSVTNNVWNAVVSSHDKIYALPKYIAISIRSTHLFLFHCFSSSSFSPVGEMTESSPISFCTHRRVCSFLSPVPPMHLAF